MTTLNEDLLARAKRLRNELDDSNARLDLQCATAMYEMEQALQAQAKRISELEQSLQTGPEIIAGLFARAANMEKERDTLRAELADAELHTKQVERGLDKATAQLAAFAATEPVAWEENIKVLADVYATKCSEFARSLALAKEDDSMSPVAAAAGDARMVLHLAIDTAHLMPAQGVEASMINLPEPVELNPAANSVMGHSDATLKQAVRDALDAQGVEDAARYRWIRLHGYVDFFRSPRSEKTELSMFDAAIDAAIAKGAK